jgi:zinc/manganese transport system substrate-binding protein
MRLILDIVSRGMRRALIAVVLAVALGAAAAVAFATSGASRVASGGPIRVVAAENFWGSIASQLGGSRVQVTSIVANPATDPHDYEPTAVDARALAGAQLVIVNGIGYDPWASKLLAANPVDGRIDLDIGDLVGLKPGANPHRWYSPADVQRAIGAIVTDLVRLDPTHAASYRAREARFETKGLARYRRLIATIRHRYHGVPVGASESIFAPLADSLRLDLVTPSSFLDAISEGTDPTAADIATIDRQVARRQLEVWVLNSQNSTPDVARITDAARKAGIPVTTITETLSPAAATFQAWQVRQLEALAAALHRATGR